MHDIAVIGYGPVGMVTAALLGQAGYDVVVLERYPTLYNLPRAAIFDDETMRTFDQLGIARGLLPKLHVQNNYEWRNGRGELLIEHSFAGVGREGWAEWYMMYQPDLEDALDRMVRALPNVQIRMGCPVDGLSQDEDGVTLTVTEAGRPQPVQARYVVACDGGNSFSRQLLMIGQDDYGFAEPWMVCDFRLIGRPGIPAARQVCDPQQPVSVISLGPDHHRFSFMLDSPESFDEESRPGRVWDRVAGYVQPGQAELIRVATYTFRSLVAERWREGRVVLAGDAAHQMPPFLGQGMCSGIRDAQNLAFKLDAVFHGADDAILDTFQSEREPHVRAVIEKGIELGRVQTMRDPVAAAERDARLLAQRAARIDPEKMIFPGLGPGMHDGSTLAGELMPQGHVISRGRSGLFDEVAVRERGFVLLVDGRTGIGIEAAVAATAAHLGIAVRRLLDRPSAVTDVVDLGAVFGSWFDASGCTAVLWRPDFYIFGTATTPDDIPALLANTRAWLNPAEVSAAASDGTRR